MANPHTQSNGFWGKTKVFFADLASYFVSKTFVRQLVLAGILSVLLIGGTLVWLKLYTRHDKQFSVPDFTGLTPSEVFALADENDLKCEISDSIYGAVGRRGTVVDQKPAADEQVKKGRTIFLTIRAFMPEMTEMPNVKGISLIQAKADLMTRGLYVGKLIYVPYQYQNLVVDQQVHGQVMTPGMKIEKGQTIDLVLGRGRSEGYAFVPNLVGLTKTRALDAVISEYLNLSVVEYDNSVVSYTDSIQAQVWQQEPAFSSRQIMGSSVKIWLTVNESKVKIGKAAQLTQKITEPEPLPKPDEEELDSLGTDEF